MSNEEFDPSIKCNGFAFTDYVMDRCFYEGLIENHTIKYLIVGKETCPTTGRLHGQGYIYFSNKRYWNAVRKLFDGKHIKPAFADALCNKTYCEKDGNLIIEYGDIPKKGARKDITDIIQMIKEGANKHDIAKKYPSAIMRMDRGISAYMAAIQAPRTVPPKVIIHFGKTGRGKTEPCIKAGGVKLHFDGKCWGNYNYEKVVILDDFNPADWVEQGKRNMLLEMLDEYPMKIRCMYGYMEWVPETIYITSNYDPANWWISDPESHDALLSRVHEIVEFVGVDLRRNKNKLERKTVDNREREMKVDSSACSDHASLSHSASASVPDDMIEWKEENGERRYIKKANPPKKRVFRGMRGLTSKMWDDYLERLNETEEQGE